MSNGAFIDGSVAKLLGVHTNRLAMTQFLGHRNSAFTGQGLSFAESRPYQAGDSQRRIDRKTSAKKQELYVKEFEEERKLRFFCAVDCAASMHFSSSDRYKTKYEYALQVSQLFWYAANALGDLIGGLGFTYRLGDYCVPKQSLEGLLHRKKSLNTLIEKQHNNQNKITESSLETLCVGLARFNIKQSVIIIFCDDFLSMPLSVMRGIAAQNDLIVFHCFDSFERTLSGGDDRMGRGVFGQGKQSRFSMLTEQQKEHYQQQFQEQQQKTERFVRQMGADYFCFDTAQDPLLQSVAFFTRRKQYRYGK